MRKFPGLEGKRLCQLGAALIVSSLFSACGGRTADFEPGNGTGATGQGDGDGDLGDGDGDPWSGGSSTGGAVGAGGSAVSTGGAWSGVGGAIAGTGGAGGRSQCSLPAEAGDCDGAIPRFHFDAATGRCEQFIYGGCGGNENNFETLGECYDTCLGKPGPEEQCTMAAECMLAFKGCCGPCGPTGLDDYWAFNSAYKEDGPWSAMACDAVLCAECLSTPAPEVGVTCESGRCTAFDTKRFAECEEDSDCRVRCGAACCGGGPPWVALSDIAGLEQLVCEPTMSCRSCVDPPEAPDAFCDNGICRVNE